MGRTLKSNSTHASTMRGGANKRELTVFLDPDRHARLREHAERIGVKIQVIVEQAWRQFADEYQEREQAGRRVTEDDIVMWTKRFPPIPKGPSQNKKMTVRVTETDYTHLKLMKAALNESTQRLLVIALDKSPNTSNAKRRHTRFKSSPDFAPTRGVGFSLKQQRDAISVVLGLELADDLESYLRDQKVKQKSSTSIRAAKPAPLTTVQFIRDAVKKKLQAVRKR